METLFGIIMLVFLDLLWFVVIGLTIEMIIDSYKDHKERKESERRKREEESKRRPNRMRDNSLIL